MFQQCKSMMYKDLLRSDPRNKARNKVLRTGIATRFLSIHSGRLPGDSGIGRVWRLKLISEILTQKK